MRARGIGVDCLADRLLEVAETPLVAEKREQKADGSVEITTGDAVDRSRLTVETLKWYLCKLAPKKYGDKVATELSGPDGGPIQAVNFRFFDDKPEDYKPDPEKGKKGGASGWTTTYGLTHRGRNHRR